MATAPADVLDSLRRADQRALRQVRRVLARAVALREDARVVATRLRRFFSPFSAGRRDPSGILRRAGRSVGRWPAAPGAASAFDRFMIDELATVAYREATIRAARDAEEPTGLRYRLSIRHVKADECDRHAERDVGYGQGVYLPADFPPREHARCLCYGEAVPLRRSA